MGLTLQSYCGDGMMGPSNLLQGRVWMLSKKELFLHTFIPQVPSVFRWQKAGCDDSHLHTTQHTTPGSSGIPEPLLCQQVVKSLEVKVPRCWYRHRRRAVFYRCVSLRKRTSMSLTTKLMSMFDGLILTALKFGKDTLRHENLAKDRNREEIPKNPHPTSPPQKRDHQHLQ